MSLKRKFCAILKINLLPTIFFHGVNCNMNDHVQINLFIIYLFEQTENDRGKQYQSVAMVAV